MFAEIFEVSFDLIIHAQVERNHWFSLQLLRMCNGARVKTAVFRAVLLCAMSAVQTAQLVGLAKAQDIQNEATMIMMSVACVFISNLATIVIYRVYKYKTINVRFAELFLNWVFWNMFFSFDSLGGTWKCCCSFLQSSRWQFKKEYWVRVSTTLIIFANPVAHHYLISRLRHESRGRCRLWIVSKSVGARVPGLYNSILRLPGLSETWCCGLSSRFKLLAFNLPAKGWNKTSSYKLIQSSIFNFVIPFPRNFLVCNLFYQNYGQKPSKWSSIAVIYLF